MKTIKSLLFALSFLLIGSFALSSCELEEDPQTPCTGCSASTPWSKPSVSNCYATQVDCENAEGAGCENCS